MLYSLKAVSVLRVGLLASAIALALAPEAGSAQAASGTIDGRVILAPSPARRTANRYPGGQAESPQIQQLPAVAYLVGRVPRAPAEAGGGSPTMAQRDTTFVPSVVIVGAGGTVAFPNQDAFFHNVFSYSSAQRFDLGRYPQGESKSVTFNEPGVVEVFCEVHEFMRGAIIVSESPFVAVVGADGSFRFTGVPEGQHTIAVWHPDHRPLEQRIEVTAGATTRVEVELRR